MLYGIKDIGKNMLGLSSYSEKLRKGEFWAVDDVSFKVKKGEILGVIGPNGSGKTTILKMLNGIFWPDKGKIIVKGRVGALIAIGAGFHPLLTGRENIYLNAAILGMTKNEVNRKFDDIVEFAGISDFLDTPVKYYSSGMFVRLGFSVAAHCEPDILLIDEVLSVGDAEFVRKSREKMISLMDSGITVIFVSHNMVNILSVCNRCIFLNKGKLLFDGPADNAIEVYYNNILDDSKNQNKSSDMMRTAIKCFPEYVVVMDIEYCDKFQKTRNFFEPYEDVVIKLTFEVKKQLNNMEIYFELSDIFKNTVSVVHSPTNKYRPGIYEAICNVNNLNISSGKIFVSIVLVDRLHGSLYRGTRNSYFFVRYTTEIIDTQYAYGKPIMLLQNSWKIKKI